MPPIKKMASSLISLFQNVSLVRFRHKNPDLIRNWKDHGFKMNYMDLNFYVKEI